MSAIRQAVIAVGIDGSPESMVAARWAADEAARRQLSLRLLHAYATTPLIGVPAYGVPSDINEGLIEAGTDALAQAVAEIEKLHPKVGFTAELVKSDPRPALIEASAMSMLTVIGRSGGGRIPEVVLGSVALHVAAHGRSPVAVISTQLPVTVGRAGRAGCQRFRDQRRGAVSYAFDEASRRNRPTGRGAGLGRPGHAGRLRRGGTGDGHAGGRRGTRRARGAAGRLAGQVAHVDVQQVVAAASRRKRSCGTPSRSRKAALPK